VRDRLITVLRDFADSLINPFDRDELLHRVTRDAIEVLDADGAGIMLERPDGELGFAAASHERVVDVEQVQARIGDGACHEAFVERRLVVVGDLRDERERWPEYVERVTASGLHGVLGVPMTAFGRTIGALNIYRERPSSWSQTDVEAAEILAAMAASYILYASQMQAQHELQEQLYTAIESRDVIGQAKGILIAREGVDADTAFQLLRSRSQSSNQKLREVARRLVDDTSSTPGH
jgi:GAF domain-containing protein